MRILVVGGGGREHALCWAIAGSPLCGKLYCAPGNAGISQQAECIPIPADDIDALLAFAHDEEIDFVVIGPEAPLVAGLADSLHAAGIKSFGPSAAAARLEGSKGFMKDLCARHDIPTAAYLRTGDRDTAIAWAQRQTYPVVIKVDGLAAGKGVTIAQDREQATAAIHEALIENRFGEAGTELVLEEFLDGEELSFFVLVDGKTALPLAGAQDHKRAYDGDQGPNTGGMGAYSPAPALTPDLEAEIMAKVIRPTIAAMAQAGCPYRGVLYAGFILTDKGPQLLEYNVRFGDPECQVLMLRLASDILPALIATHDGSLDQIELSWRQEAALSVVMATKGYPGAYTKGTEIKGLEKLAGRDDLQVFHAGTRAEQDRLLANGGRVLNITARAQTIAGAQQKAYAAIAEIDWPDGFYRTDIGWRAIS
ncbi:MAG: phosphoribosylamine--glycine ligase [Alphaproteobacteria bacterium]